MRILICCNAYPPYFMGGAEWIAHYQAKALLALGHDVRIFAGQPVDERSRRNEINVALHESLPVHRVGLTQEDFRPDFVNFSHPRVEELFFKLLQDFKPEVVHFHNLIGLSVSVIRIAREFGARTLMTLHDYWGFCFKNTLLKTATQTCQDYTRCAECLAYLDDGKGRGIPMSFRKDYFSLLMHDVDQFISPSQFLAETYVQAGFPQERMNVVWNGIDYSRFSKVSPTASSPFIRFTYLGSFGEHKGLDVLLSALPLMDHHQRVQLNLVGPIEGVCKYFERIRQMGMDDRILCWGQLDNSQIERALSETDVLVLPSIWQENQPVSITEAMATGIPVIASKVGGIPELVEHGITGYLFEPGNPRDLAARMDELAASAERRLAFGLAGQRRMLGNTYERSARQLEDVYAKAMSATRVENAETCRATFRPPKPPEGRPTPSTVPDHAPLSTVNTDIAQANVGTNGASLDVPLIACIGSRIESDTLDALEQLPNYYLGAPPRMIMAEWLTESQLSEAHLIWVVGDVDAWSALALAEKYALPLVVPAGAELLAAQCRLRDGGLYYADGHEAAACIAYLLSHDSERRALGRQMAEYHPPQNKPRL